MTNLNFPDVVPYTGPNVETGINDALLAADMAARRDVTLDLSAGNAAPTAEEARRTMLWRLSGVATSGRSVTLPAVAKPYLVYLPLSASDPVDIIKGSTTLSHPVGSMKWYYAGSGANDLYSPVIYGGGIQSVTGSDFVGCAVGLTATDETIAGNTDIFWNWYRRYRDTHGFHENVTNPDRFTIPDGVDKVEFLISWAFASGLFNERVETRIVKNGLTAFPGEQLHTTIAGGQSGAYMFRSGPIDCTSGDYFQIGSFVARAGTFTLNTEKMLCVMRVVGGALFDGAYSAVPVDVKMQYVSGTPSTSSVIYKRLLTQRATFPANFAGSIASVLNPPSSTTTLDVKDNGSTIGTIQFDTAGDVTFATTSGTEKTVDAGDRITIETQGSVNGIAGIAATLKGYAN